MPPEPAKPTDSEIAILQALWAIGPASVRDIHAHLKSETGYTSTLKLMQIMFGKGLLLRTLRGRLHVYRPAQAEAKTHRRLAADLIDRAFGGSARKLIVAALCSRRVTPQELAEIRQLLEDSEKETP